MSGNPLLVTFEALANAEQAITACANQLNSQLDDLHQMLQPLVSTWQGAAYEAYQVQQNAWTQAQTDATTVLQSIAKVVSAAHDAYVSTENANRSAWSA